MSKNLEKEYKALVNSEVPDLWARIEAGLDEKETVDKKKIIHFKVWGTVAAACVCAGLVIPVFRSYLYMEGGSSSSPQYTNNAPAAGAAQDTAADSAAPADMAVSGDIPEAVPDNGGGFNNSAMEDSGAIDEAVAEEAAGITEQEETVFRTEVEILSVDLRLDSGPVYKARVIRSDNPALETDAVIEIVSYPGRQDGIGLFEQGEVLELTLCEEVLEGKILYKLVDDTPGQ